MKKPDVFECIALVGTLVSIIVSIDSPVNVGLILAVLFLVVAYAFSLYERFSTISKVEGLEAQLEIAQNAYDDTSLKAPFDGIVAATFVENFENVTAKESILLLQDIEHVEIVINIPEGMVAAAREKSRPKALAVFETLPDQEFEVTLKEFSTEADPATQTYKATLTMPRPERALGILVLPGMTCRVILEEPIADEEGASQFAIPAVAVFEQQGKRYAWVIDASDTAQSREVQVEDLTGENIRVIGGLQLGETIAISGVHFLREGMKVRKLGTEIGDQLK